jgi:hypothetical protein
MNTIEANHRVAPKRAPRLWIIETLVVLGVLGFGYFALTLDSTRWTQPAPAEIDPLSELIR